MYIADRRGLWENNGTYYEMQYYKYSKTVVIKMGTRLYAAIGIHMPSFRLRQEDVTPEMWATMLDDPVAVFALCVL